MKAVCVLLMFSIVSVAAEQPLPFSHKQHVEAGMKCQDCHPNPDPGRAMTFPAAQKCMICHRTIASDKPAIQKLAGLAASGEAIAWVRVATVPSWVFWSHRPHLKAALKCESCHGDVARMEAVTQVTSANKMTGCLQCHRERKATTECASCHDIN